MIIDDIVWGEFEINEAVLEEIINTKPLQRLKGIAQYGLPYEYYPLPGFNRYEHSVGVFLLLRKLGSSLEEQIAGLTHDVSHTAFWHLVDWAIGDREKEDFQDNRHEKIILNSEINNILRKYGFSTEKIANHKNYSLLERHAPDLCADRVDYAVREFNSWTAPEIVDIFVRDTIKYNEKIVFSSEDTANLFSINYLKCQREHWGGVEWTLRWEIFANLLKYSLANKILHINDFSSEDKYVIDKMKSSNDKKVKEVLTVLSGNLKYEIVTNNPDYHLKKKFRYIDPEYLKDGKLYRLSEEDRNYRSFLEQEREHNLRGIRIKLLA